MKSRRLKVVPAIIFAGSILQAYQNPTTPEPANTSESATSKLQGHVSDAQSGEPIRKATVRLTRRDRTGNGFAAEGYLGTSESDGSFRFEGVEPGEYNLSGEHAGYLDTQYGARGLFQQGTTLTVHAGQDLSGLSLSLIPQGVASGRVVDEDGDPVAGASVQVIRRYWMRGAVRTMPFAMAATDDAGDFRVSRLQQGRYYLLANKERGSVDGNFLPADRSLKDERAIPTFFPDAASLDSASAVEIRAGQSTTGLEIRLRTSETFHVRGKITGNGPAEQDRLILSIYPQGDRAGRNPFEHSASIGKDRSFDFAGIAAGTYVVDAADMSGNVRSLAHQTVEVSSTDVNDLVLDLVPPGSLRGEIRLEGGSSADTSLTDLSVFKVSLSSSEPDTLGSIDGQANVKADGSFVLENIPAGTYSVSATGNLEGTYMASVRFGQQELTGKTLDLSHGVAGDIQIVFRYGAPEVEGTVEIDPQSPAITAGSRTESAPKPAISVVLIPDSLTEYESGMYFANTDQNGKFTIKQIRPGHYRAVAMEQVSFLDLQNPDVLTQIQARGQDVDLKENDKKALQLSVLPASEVQKILEQAGL